MRDLLISNVIYPCADDFKQWIRGDLAISGEEIVEVGRDLPRSTRQHVDGSCLIALPGFWNMHTHAHDMVWRGTREGARIDRSWPEWFLSVYDAMSTAAYVASATAAYIDSLRNGVTFVADHLRRTLDGSAFVKAMESVGLLGTIFASRPYSEESPLSLPHETAPGFEETLEWAAGLSRRPLMIHAQETPLRLEHVQRSTGRSTVELLDYYGLLHENTYLIHLCSHSESDLALAAARGAALVITPCAEMKLGEPTLSFGRATRVGLRCFIGTDGPAYQNTNDLFADLKLAALLWAREQGPEDVRVEELLAAVTWRAAEAFGKRGGRLGVGEPANLILLGSGSLSLEPLVCEPFNNLAAQLVYSASGADVRHVIVKGRMLVKNRRCLVVDETTAVAALREVAGQYFKIY